MTIGEKARRLRPRYAQPGKLGQRAWPWMIATLHLYLVGIGIWAVLHLTYGDRWWWLFLLNTFAVYLIILPLPLLLIMALLTRRRDLWVGLGAMAILWTGLYGRARIGDIPIQPNDTRPTLTVMTSNILGYNEEIDAGIQALRRSGADVIGLQELNPSVASAIQRELADTYPYQVLAPKNGVTGMGVISRYPITPTEAALPGRWVGGPQVLDLSWEGETITLVNFHAIPPGTYRPAVLNYTISERERQAQLLAELAASRPGPVILLGDLNASERSDAYAIMTEDLHDVWRENGWGLGHTFPGALSDGSSRPVIAGLPAPKWLVRLDYVFHNQAWETQSARIGPWDGYSDHRPVIATLALTSDAAQR